MLIKNKNSQKIQATLQKIPPHLNSTKFHPKNPQNPRKTPSALQKFFICHTERSEVSINLRCILKFLWIFRYAQNDKIPQISPPKPHKNSSKALKNQNPKKNKNSRKFPTFPTPKKNSTAKTQNSTPPKQNLNPPINFPKKFTI